MRASAHTVGACIAASDSPLAHYIIVRCDLSHGLQVANAIHAAGESSDRVPSGTVAVALHARNASHLERISEELDDAGLEHELVVEADGPHAGEPMAIGVEPTADRESVRRVLSQLPLVR